MSNEPPCFSKQTSNPKSVELACTATASGIGSLAASTRMRPDTSDALGYSQVGVGLLLPSTLVDRLVVESKQRNAEAQDIEILTASS